MKKAMKKIVTLALTVAMVVSMAACGNGDAETNSGNNAEGSNGLSGKITFLTNRTDLDNDGTYEELIAKFNEKYPDVTVEVQSITDYAGELATRMQTSEHGDVLMIPDAVPKSEYGKFFESFGTVEELSSKYREG